jgi:ubiquinone biosynthesis protein
MQLQAASEIPGEIARATDVARVLVKYGLAWWLEGTEWAPVRRVLTSDRGHVLTDESFAVRMRLAVTDLGTTFIKLGQVLGTRPDLVGPEVAAELSKLQDGTPADPADVVVATIERELSRPITECFAEFDREAMASASIGQVHRAKLPNGRRVVVKVQHAGIEGTIHRDLNILSGLAKLAERQEDIKRYRPTAVVKEFRETLMRELDFRREMRNLQQFRRNFADDETVAFPKPYPELTTGRVLTMQMFTGTSVGDAEKLKHRRIDTETLAKKGAGVFVQMILRDGFYHADPHPGNLVVLSKGRLGILDAGMVSRLDEGLREKVVELILAAGDKDAERFTDIICEICKAPPNLDRAALSGDLADVFVEYATQSVGRFDVGGALTAITRLMHEYNVFMPSRLSMLIKCLIVLEGTGRGLNAEFNLVELMEPYRRQFLRQQMSPERWLRKGRRLQRDWELLMQTIPRSVNGLLEQLRTGDLTVRVKQPPLETSVNRLVYGLCTSALLLSSAMLWTHEAPPTMWGVSVLGVAGFVLGLLTGIRLLWVVKLKRKKGE